MHLEPNQISEGDINPQQAHSSRVLKQTGEDQQAHATSSNLVPSLTCQDNMETGEGDGNVNEHEMRGDKLSATANVTGYHLLTEGDNEPNSGDYHAPVRETVDVDMNIAHTILHRTTIKCSV